MATTGIRISQLPGVSSAQLTDIVPVVQNGVTNSESWLNVLNLFLANLNAGTPLTDGQLIIGKTGFSAVAGSLTAGSNISITPSAGGITIAGTASPGIGWNNITAASATMISDAGYMSNNAGLVTLTLPAVAAFGTNIYVQGFNTGGWSIAQNVGQRIQVGSVSSTAGVGGSVASTNRYDSIRLICVVANTTWCALGGPQGNLTIV